MRVISGLYRGRQLVAPKGLHTRPTLDRAKETIFNIIQPYIEGAVCLDVFGGSGQIAVELISRGAFYCAVIDNSAESFNAITTNFVALNIPTVNYKIIRGEFDSVIPMLGEKFDLIYIDPPYQSDLYSKVLNRLEQCNCVTNRCIAVCEYGNTENLPENIGSWRAFKYRKCGSVSFCMYRRSVNEQ